ncbi:MAG: hypothetical protein HZB56_11915 [Deltaproteobacteria bacterium]|nr:hypothetical protein [Deltaproteobacteria bacterium]
MRRLPWALLALSLVLNGWLLLRGSPRGAFAGAPGATQPAGSAPAATPGVAPRLDASSSGLPGGTVPAPRPAAGAPAGPEAARVAALEAEVARLEKEHFRALPLHERFEKSTGGPEAEARIRQDLEHALRAADVRAWSLACRGSVCRLEILTSDDRSWQQPFQGDADFRRWVRGLQLAVGTPRTDPLSGETYVESQIHLEVRDEPDVLSPELWRLVQAFKSSSALADCTGGYAEKGSYQARVDLGTQGIAVASAGSLATGAAGRCLEDRLRAAVAPLAGGSAAGCTDCGAVAFVELVSPPAP